MGFDKRYIYKLKANEKISTVFVKIIDDLPKNEEGLCVISSNKYLVKTMGGNYVNYEGFYCDVLQIISNYLPRENENVFLKFVKSVPRVVNNCKSISRNRKIIDLQNYILKTYFQEHGPDNVKDKIQELKNCVQEMINEEFFEEVDLVIERFEDRMRNGLLVKLNELVYMLEKEG